MKVYVVTGEPSGDALAAPIVSALRDRRPDLTLEGVGGPALKAEGMRSLFPLADVSVMGLSAVLARLPTLIKRIRQTADDAARAKPDVVLLVDSPDFTQRVGARLRQLDPSIPIIKVVSPSVWAWRPGRAKAMTAYTDHLLALLPFEPQVHERLGGPPTTYIGHPLAEVDALRHPAERLPLGSGPTNLLVLPGSRAGEVSRNMAVMGETVGRLADHIPSLAVSLVAVPHLRDDIECLVRDWPVSVAVLGPEEKHKAMRTAHAALAVSGTVTLELALAGVPMAAVYRLDPMVVPLQFLVSVPSIVLPNLVIGRNAFPEFVHKAAKAEDITPTFIALLQDGPERAAQLAACSDVLDAMKGSGRPPSEVAADAILNVVESRG